MPMTGKLRFVRLNSVITPVGNGVICVNIRPIDLQVLIPRTTDVAKTAAINERQSATNQQQISEQFKQAANERQHQVETADHGAQAGVTTEDLNQERQHSRPRQDNEDEKKDKETADDGPDTAKKRSTATQDPIRGRTIDIKT